MVVEAYPPSVNIAATARVSGLVCLVLLIAGLLGGGWVLGTLVVLVVSVICLVGVLLKYRRDSLEIAYLCACALRAKLDPPTAKTQRNKGVTTLDCRRDAWILAKKEYIEIEKRIRRSDAEGFIPYMRLLATYKERGSSNQRVAFTRGEPQTYGHAKQFRVIPRANYNRAEEALEVCAYIGVILDQVTQLLGRSQTEIHQPIWFERLCGDPSLPDARALLQALYVGHAWGLVELGGGLSHVKLVGIIFQSYTAATAAIGDLLQIRLSENGVEWLKVPDERKSQAVGSRDRQAKTTAYFHRVDNVIFGGQNDVRVTKMEKDSGGYFENNQSVIGVQGPNAHVRKVSQPTGQRQESGDVGDLSKLIAELDKLRSELNGLADTADKSRSVAEVHDAKEAAERSDKGAIERHLHKAGQWALDVAMRVGLPIAEAALKQALGISS